LQEHGALIIAEDEEIIAENKEIKEKYLKF
jgi:hypothetical protein